MSKIKNNQHIIIPLVVFLIIFLVGLVIFDDYGISVDEMAERKTSLITFKYILTNAFGVEEFHEVLEVEPDLKAFKDQFYGVALQLPTIFIEYLSGFTMDIRTVTKMRHLWVFTNFYLSLIAFFFLLKKRFENWKIGLIGVIILVFSPRIFADSFYNIKDLLFLPWFIFAVFSFYRFINNPNILNALFFSIVSALLINTRIVGAIVPGFAGIYLIVKWIRHDISFKRMISISALIILSIGCLWTLFLPTSWDNPLETFKLTLSIFSKYSLKITELYFGKLVPSQNVPWHYVPVWISITTPIFYQLLFVIGNFCLFRNLKKSDFENQFFDISMVSFFFLPIITAIVLNSTIYNGWRHFYFIYFPFVYIACFTVYSILSSEKLKFKKVFSITAILSLIFTGQWMIKNHPYQMVYFQPLVRKSAAGNFSLDYWHLSTNECLQFILTSDKSQGIQIAYPTAGLPSFLHSFVKEDRNRITDAPPNSWVNTVKYIIYNYTNNFDNEMEFPFYDRIYNVETDDFKLASVFERSHRDELWGNDYLSEVTTNISSDEIANAFDGDFSTGWTTSQPQNSEDFIEIELSNTYNIYGVSVYSDTNLKQFPRSLEISTSMDGVIWEAAKLGYHTNWDYSFENETAKFIRLRNAESFNKENWTVNEIVIFGQVAPEKN